MGIPIDELQGRVSSRRFAEYWAFHQVEPIGPEREDLRMAIVASVVANVNRNPKKRPKPYVPKDFMAREFMDLVEVAGDDELTEEEQAAKIDELMTGIGTDEGQESVMHRREGDE
jgi:hypothetical protein